MHIQAQSPAADEVLRAALPGLGALVEVEQVVAPDWVVEEDVGTWTLTETDNAYSQQFSSAGDLLHGLFGALGYRVAEGMTGGHCLHAAAVARNGRAIVLPGVSGRGKSSVCAWLVAQGFEYISDELVVVDGDGQVTGFGRPLQLKRGSYDAVAPLVVNEEHVVYGDTVSSYPPEAFAGTRYIGSSLPIAAWLFPAFESGAGFSLRELSSAQCALQVLQAHVNARNLPNYGFCDTVGIVKNVSGYQLDYSSIDCFSITLPEFLKKLSV
jgi:hypothetical protein